MSSSLDQTVRVQFAIPEDSPASGCWPYLRAYSGKRELGSRGLDAETTVDREEPLSSIIDWASIPVGTLRLDLELACYDTEFSDEVIASITALVDRSFPREVFGLITPSRLPEGKFGGEKIVSQAPSSLETYLVDARGRVIKSWVSSNKTQHAVPLTSSADIERLKRREVPTGVYELRLDLDTPTSSTRTVYPIRVEWGWTFLARLSERDPPVVTWKRCRTISWSLDHGGAPSGVGEAGLRKDIVKSLVLLGKWTGLSFVPSGDAKSADVKFRWAGRDEVGAASGVAYAEYSTPDYWFNSGEVLLSKTDQWPRRPGFNPGGRGALLLHEMAHVLGLGHVKGDLSLMSEFHFFGRTPTMPTKDELRAFRFLYQPHKC